MTGGLLTVSEAQHEELVTGGDAYGSPGVVEDVTEFGEFETETTAEVTSSVDTTSSSDGSDTKKKTALLALGAVAIGAIAFGGTN